MPRSRFNLVLIATLVGAILVSVVLHERKGDWNNPAQTSSLAPQTALTDPCLTSSSLAAAIEPFAKGEIAALQRTRKPVQLPDIRLEVTKQSQPLSNMQGRVTLLNLWATWCVPCREEMPSLDRLQARLGGDNFEVVALNMDTRNLERVPQWLDTNGITALVRYMDPGGKAFQSLRGIGKVSGLPTTFLLDRKGCLIAEMAGPADWASEDAIALIERAIKG
jgi:thiol-disulfide isomerase/thioredoxin